MKNPPRPVHAPVHPTLTTMNSMTEQAPVGTGPGRRLIAALISALALWAAQGPALAANPGTGGGIGGTGISNEGIGGTGISSFGVVQRFGSIFVNGSEYFLTPKTRYYLDSHPGSAKNLHLGDVVLVRARNRASGRLTAGSVRLQITLAGHIGRVGADRFTLLGQVVRITADTQAGNRNTSHLDLSRLHAGEAVRVSALALGKDRWIATRVTPGSPSTFLLRGTVHGVDRARGYITVGTRRLAAASGLSAQFRTGEPVRVTGHYVRGAPVVTALKRVAIVRVAPGTNLDMSGYVEKTLSRGVLVANGMRLRYTPATRVRGGTASDVLPGAPIAVHGRTEPDGSVLVDRMVLGTRPMQVNLSPLLVHRPSGARPALHGKPKIERPEIERPEIERPEIEHPELPELPDLPDH